jgi:hypothetical protein
MVSRRLLGLVGAVAVVALVSALNVRSATAQATVPVQTAVYSTTNSGVSVTPAAWRYGYYGRPYGYRGYYRGPYAYRSYYAPRYYSYYPGYAYPYYSYPYVVPYSTYYYPGYVYPNSVYFSAPIVRGYVPLGRYYW